MLREACRGVFLVQTAKSDHPVFGEPSQVFDHLLDERRTWNLPPYSRLVDIKSGETKDRITLVPDRTLAARKREILSKALDAEKRSGVRAVIDVDPL